MYQVPQYQSSQTTSLKNIKIKKRKTMILEFKNSHIFFAVESIWGNLNYKFKYMLNAAITANSDNDFVQSLDIPTDILLQIFSAVTVQPEGVAAYLNRDMLQSLLPQIMSVSNIDAVNAQPQEDKEPQPGDSEKPSRITYNEAAQILMAIQVIDQANKTTIDSKILSGKTQILL